MSDDRKNVKGSGPQIEEYVRVNLWAWGFLGLLALVAFFACGAVWDEVTQGVMEFLFGIMGGGFVLVSVMDYLYESQRARPMEKRQ
ncbi:MAG TPA: hypothetical protein VHE12_07680 [bacterium]|nr:hypothetical protein [bacterium]